MKNKDKLEHIKQKVSEVKDNIEEYIDKNPVKSSLIGLGVGLVVGCTIGKLLRLRK